MKEQTWRYLVDVVLFVCLTGMAVIGGLLGLVIPKGSAAAEGSKYFLGLHRHQWGNLHAYLSVVFVVLIVIHIILNWKWITCRTSQIFKSRPAPVLILGAVLPFLVLAVFWLFSTKNDPSYEERGGGRGGGRRIGAVLPEQTSDVEGIHSREEHSGGKGLSTESEIRRVESEREDHRTAGGLVITGQMTLLDIEQATGLSAKSIAERMGLPSSASLHERLGRLRRQYGIEIQGVRDLVEAMLKERKPNIP